MMNIVLKILKIVPTTMFGPVSPNFRHPPLHMHTFIIYIRQFTGGREEGGIWSDQVTNQSGGLLGRMQLVST
jgi:hypothetical protein